MHSQKYTRYLIALPKIWTGIKNNLTYFHFTGLLLFIKSACAYEESIFVCILSKLYMSSQPSSRLLCNINTGNKNKNAFHVFKWFWLPIVDLPSRSLSPRNGHHWRSLLIYQFDQIIRNGIIWDLIFANGTTLGSSQYLSGNGTEFDAAPCSTLHFDDNGWTCLYIWLWWCFEDSHLKLAIIWSSCIFWCFAVCGCLNKSIRELGESQQNNFK